VSELWQLPQSWAWTKMGEIAEVVGGGTPPTNDPKNFDGEIPWITPADLSGYREKYIARGSRNITHHGYEASGAKWLPQGSVLFSSRAPIGYVAIASAAVTTNQGFKSFIPPSGVDPNYLYYWLRSAKHLAEDLASGTTFKEISGAKAALIPFPLAPAVEQTRIVAKLEELLSDLDAGVAELKAAQKKLQQYRLSLLKAAVEGALTADWREAQRQQGTPTETGAQLLARILTERRARWEAKQLANFKEQGKAPPKDWQKKYPEPVHPETGHLRELPEGWAWVTAEMLFTWGSGDFLPSSAQIAGDFSIYGGNGINGTHSEANVDHVTIVIGRVGVNCGNVYLTASASWITDNAIYATAKHDHLRWDYAELAMKAANLGSGSKGGAQPFISQKILNDTLMALPSRHEQEQISEEYRAALASCQEMALGMEEAFSSLSTQRQNILRAAFAGQLVPQDPNDEPASFLLERIRTERTGRASMSKVRNTKKYAEA
jgi:type I restriction enzyme, S subunit